MPIDCAGHYDNTACYGGFKASVFNIDFEPSNGGEPCPQRDVIVSSCPHTARHLDWAYVVPKDEWSTATRASHAREIPLIVCPLGSKVNFTWSGTMHDVWQLPTEESYNVCDFGVQGAAKVSDASTSSMFQYSCDEVGTYYFACSVDDACTSGNQKVRIYVSDPAKTVELRARGGVSLEAFNRNYTLLFAGYFLNNQDIASANMNNALQDAQSLLERSPESCSDWIPASWNSNQSCQAFVYTDLGFIARAGPNSDFEASERYYRTALRISPGMCGATSYLAELRVQQNMKTEADQQYREACRACGEYSLDFFDLLWAYEQRGWTPPSCPRTMEFVQTVQFSNLDAVGNTSTLQNNMRNAVATAATVSPADLTVMLSEIQVQVSYANIPDWVTHVQVGEAIANTNNVSRQMVRVAISNGRRLHNLRQGRSLAYAVDVEILINASSGMDIVEKAKQVRTASQNTSALATAISEASGATSPSALTLVEVPTLSAVFDVVAQRASDVPFSSSGVQDAVGANLGGTVTAYVAVVHVGIWGSTTSTTTTSSTTSTTSIATTITSTTTSKFATTRTTTMTSLNLFFQMGGEQEAGACSLWGNILPILVVGLALSSN